MRFRRAGFALFFVILAVLLLGSGVGSARSAQTHVDPALGILALTKPTGHTGRRCHTRPDAVSPDPADV
jgi:hypothetical protein